VVAEVDYVRENNKTGNFEFWYEWCKNKILVTGWRKLRNEVYKHYIFLTWTQDGSKGPHSSQAILLPENTSSELHILVRMCCWTENSKFLLQIEPRIPVISTRIVIICHLHCVGSYGGTERDN
jgi:hypothetical protein